MSDINPALQFEDGIHPNLKLLSHSSSVLSHKCPRKYELYKLKGQDVGADDGDEHLIFGDVVGFGVQEFLATDSVTKAKMAMFMRWDRMIDDDTGEKSKKTFWHALYAVDKFSTFRQQRLSSRQLVAFSDRPATELGFSIDLGHGFFYRGFLDALMFENVTQKLEVIETKTTKFKNLHEAVYKHSGQGMGYFLVVQAVARLLGLEQGASTEVLYPVYKTGAYEWELFKFPKSHTQLAKWIKDLLRDKQHIAEFATDGHFPMRGENCYDFFRPCPYFGTCELSNAVLAPKPEVKVEAEDLYPFKFKLEDLIEQLLAA